MSSSKMSTAAVDRIQYINLMLMEVWSYFLICLGAIGHTLNIYVFTRPKLRSNPCVRYFLASTISGYFVTFVNVPLRLLQLIYSIDAFGYSTASCKILTYLVQWARAQTSWFIALACIDRFLSSSRSVTIRKWSNVHAVSLISLSAIVAVGLAFMYIPIQYQIQQGSSRCPTKQGSNLIFSGLWNLIIFGLGPSTIMLIFGSLTARHVRSSVRRIALHNNNAQNQLRPLPPQEQSQRQKMTDRQLTQMTILQFIYFSLLASPVSANWIYMSVSSNSASNALQSAKDDLFSNITGYLGLPGACTTFYIFTLSSQLFRRELVLLFKGRWRTNREVTTNTVALTRKH